jgi:MFS transporter, SHS family, sialic acid transporter
MSSATSSRSKVMALIAAFLGWLFDGFEMGLFPLIGKPALQDLLPHASVVEQGDWFSVIIAVFLVGAATGGVLFGWLGDKMGRVKAMTLAIFTYAIFTGLCGFVPNGERGALLFAVLRFMASLGMGGEWSLGVALVNELWAGRNRAWIAGMIGAASNIGFLLTGILSLLLNGFLDNITSALHSIGLSEGASAYLLHNRAWRFLAVSGALPALINFFILVFVPESHKWEEEKKTGKTSHWETWDLLGVLIAAGAALVIIYVWSPMAHVATAVERDNSRFALHLDNIGTATAGIITLICLGVALWGYLYPVRKYLDRSVAAHERSSAKEHSIMRNLLLGAGLASVALLGTWGSAQQAAKWSSFRLPPSDTTPVFEWSFGLMPKASIIEIVVMLTALGAILVTVIAPLVADKLGRRVTYTALCAASLAIAIAFFSTHATFAEGHLTPWFYISAFLLGGITASFYGFFPLYFPELFPTSVRATGQGFCFNFGRLIAAIGALQIGNLTSLFVKDGVSVVQSTGNAYSALSCVYLIGMIIIWMCPETKGKALE